MISRLQPLNSNNKSIENNKIKILKKLLQENDVLEALTFEDLKPFEKSKGADYLALIISYEKSLKHGVNIADWSHKRIQQEAIDFVKSNFPKINFTLTKEFPEEITKFLAILNRSYTSPLYIFPNKPNFWQLSRTDYSSLTHDFIDFIENRKKNKRFFDTTLSNQRTLEIISDKKPATNEIIISNTCPSDTEFIKINLSSEVYYYINAINTTKIGVLKNSIANSITKEQQILPDRLRVFYTGHELVDDSKTLAEYNIPIGHAITVMIKPLETDNYDSLKYHLIVRDINGKSYTVELIRGITTIRNFRDELATQMGNKPSHQIQIVVKGKNICVEDDLDKTINQKEMNDVGAIYVVHAKDL
jgi:hypothetical protein